ncbi:MAG: hypothetical protein A2283_08710 [Lentisphaerae bacterium RIFOXYA12_FULL_48_11]|nr:MAG: hypothetical protein A2283_08710 [Lentisphaerae bacterium RIFOXYA12_FULL_48_11]
MKINVVWAVIAMVAGFVLGGWGLRADLRKVKDELKSIQSKTEKSARRSTELQGIRTMLRLPENKISSQDPQQNRKFRHSHAHQDTNTATDIQRPSTGSVASVSSTNNPNAKRRSMSEDIKKASELWKTRVALARNSFVSNAALNKEQEDRFDVLLEAMNLRLGDSIEKWSDYLKVKGEMSPEDGIRMMKDLSESMVITYDELDRNMPQDWRDKSGENFQLFNFIDPEVAKPLIEVEDILGKAQPPHPGQIPQAPPTSNVKVEFNVNPK